MNYHDKYPFTGRHATSVFNQVNYTISPEQAKSRWYKEALDYELFAGRVSNLKSLESSGINHRAILEYKGRILGNRSQVYQFADWTEFLINDYGPRKKCLSLGSGTGRVERFLMEKGFTERFEAIELCGGEGQLLKIDDERATVSQGDLNFTVLPEDSYDFVLCHGVLHHLINLEFVLEQINRSLTANGILLIYEYIGETRWQFGEERMEILRAKFPHLKFKLPLPWQVRGFEAVRSSDLMGLIEAQFGDTCEKKVNYGGLFFPLVICNSTYSDADVVGAVEIDQEISNQEKVGPCYHMGIYHRSSRAASKANPWKDDVLRESLAPRAPLVDRLRWKMRRSRSGDYIRALKNWIRGPA